MKKTHIISTAIIIALALTATPAFAKKGKGTGEVRGNGDGKGYGEGHRDFEPGEGRFGKRGKRHGNRGMRWLKQLDISADQKVKIDALKANTKSTTEPLRDKLRTLKQQMRAAWQVDAPNKGNILSLHRKIHKIKGEIGKYRIQLRLDVFAILTPEQRAKTNSLRENRHERRGRRGKFQTQ